MLIWNLKDAMRVNFDGDIQKDVSEKIDIAPDIADARPDPGETIDASKVPHSTIISCGK